MGEIDRNSATAKSAALAWAAFLETEPAKTIPSAYEVIEFRLEVYELLYPLRPEGGPFAG